MSLDSQPTARPLLGLGSWSDVLWLAAVSSTLLLTLLPFSSYIASIPLIREEWGMSNSQSAIVFSAYLVGYAVSSVVLLPATDRLRPGPVLAVSVAVIALSNLLFPLLAHDLWTALVLRFFAGAGHVGAYIPGIRLVSLRFAGGARGTAVSIFVSAGYAGTTVSYVFMGQLLGATDSWRTAYLITSLVGLAGLAVAVVLLKKGGAGPGPKSQVSGRLDLSILRHRPMLLINVAYALHTAELYLARLWLPLLLSASFGRHPLDDGSRRSRYISTMAPTAAMSPTAAAALAATWSGFMFMTGIAGVFVGGVISDRFGRTIGAAAIFTVSGAVSFLAGWLLGFDPYILIAVGFVYGFATAADSAIYSTAVTELAPSHMIGSTQAVQSFVGFSVGAAAPVLAGALLDMFQGDSGWRFAFGFNGVLAVFGVGALLLLRRHADASRMAGGRR